MNIRFRCNKIKFERSSERIRLYTKKHIKIGFKLNHKMLKTTNYTEFIGSCCGSSNILYRVNKKDGNDLKSMF